MERTALEVLASFRLPTTRAWSLDELSEDDGPEAVYVRFTTEAKRENGYANLVLTRADLARKRESLAEAAKRGLLSTIETKYTTFIGGVTLVSGLGMYTEMVKGHSVVLLRRGYCGARLIRARKTGFERISKTVQFWEADQLYRYVYSPSTGVTNADIERVQLEIEAFWELTDREAVVEWMLTAEDGFVCCDFKWREQGGLLSSIISAIGTDSVVRLIGLSQSPQSRPRIDCLDVDSADYDPFADVLIANGALLSHAVTYRGLEDGCVTWNAAYDCWRTVQVPG